MTIRGFDFKTQNGVTTSTDLSDFIVGPINLIGVSARVPGVGGGGTFELTLASGTATSTEVMRLEGKAATSVTETLPLPGIYLRKGLSATVDDGTLDLTVYYQRVG